MNRFFKTILPLLLCVSMLLPVFSAFAETSEKPDPTDLDKMREFFSQLTDEDNVTNGTRVLSIVYGEHTEYDPTDYSQLPLMKNIEWSDGLINEFNSTVHLDPCTWPVGIYSAHLTCPKRTRTASTSAHRFIFPRCMPTIALISIGLRISVETISLSLKRPAASRSAAAASKRLFALQDSILKTIPQHLVSTCSDTVLSA